jgi:hypothetical protein
LALLLDLSDNFLKSAQFNIIISSQENMDWVGVEPTSSAMPNIDRKKSLFKPHTGPIYYLH